MHSTCIILLHYFAAQFPRLDEIEKEPSSSKGDGDGFESRLEMCIVLERVAFA